MFEGKNERNQSAGNILKTLKTTESNPKLIAVYENGYHMLLRDLQASVLWNDINVWIHKSSSLPSGADKRALEWLLKN